jgi:hypothetical protein
MVEPKRKYKIHNDLTNYPKMKNERVAKAGRAIMQTNSSANVTIKVTFSAVLKQI